MKNGSWNLTNSKRMLTPLVFSIVLFSCSKEKLSELPQESPNELALATATATTSSISPNVIWRETFEGSTVWNGVYKQFGTSHAFTVASNPVSEGLKSGRFELRDSDPEQSGGTRAEVLFPEQTNLHRWYSFAAYFPSANYANDSYTEIINQFHQGGGLSPSIALEVKNGNYNLVIPSSAAQTSSTVRLDLGAMKKDLWNRFVWHIKHSAGSDGLIQLWVNGTKIVDRSGPNMYSATYASGTPRWKLGIYKWKWNGTATTDVNKRVLYFDDIRIGKETSAYADMTSTSTTTNPDVTPPPPTTTTSGAVQSFTLINASTDSDVMTVTNGATISLSALGVTKFNIRANTASGVASVNFALSGHQSRNYTDKQFPFSVQGDSGTGNYYYGSWDVPAAYGTYTLKATPYADALASGTPGTATTISFTISK